MPLAETELEIHQVRKLIQCVREQQTSSIDKLIELGIPNLVNYQDPGNGCTALHVAVTVNLENIVSQLLEHGANGNIQDNEGCTALMRACEHGHCQSLEALSMKALSLQTSDKNGLKAVFYCLHPTNRHLKCLSFLLEYGADPNTKSADGVPVLYAACKGGFDKHVECLLDKGADPNARDPGSDKPAVVVASEGKHHSCLRLLAVSGANLNAPYGETKLTALHRAAILGYFECLQVLSAYGADFSVTSKTGDNALHCCTLAYKLLCIRFLGQRNCPANDLNEEGLSPQKIAKNEGTKDAMKELKKLTGYQDKVAKGGKPKGFTELWAIQLFDWLQVNKLLLWELLKASESNVDGVMSVEEFQTILKDMNVPLGDDEWTKILKIYDKKNEGKLNWDDLLTDHKYVHAQFKLGPNDDPKAKKGKKGKKKGGKKGGKKGKTKIIFPIYYEAERPPVAGVSQGYLEKDELLTDYQRFSSNSSIPNSFIDDSHWYLIPPDRRYVNMYEVIRHGDFETLNGALDSGLPLDARDKFNKTLLMIACAHGRTDVAQFLLTKGADINAIDNFMWTPLHHACHAGEEKVVKLLLDGGALLDNQSFNGGTPLMRAIETSQRNIVKLLLEKGAKPAIENKHGDTALDVARNWGDEFIHAMVYHYTRAASNSPKNAKDGKGKKDNKGKDNKKTGKGKKGKKADKSESNEILPGPPIIPLPETSRLPNPVEHIGESRKRYSLQSLQAETIVQPLPVPLPKPAWTTPLISPRTFHNEQQVAREERGIETTDFDETKSPFQLQILARAKAVEISEL